MNSKDAQIVWDLFKSRHIKTHSVMLYWYCVTQGKRALDGISLDELTIVFENNPQSQYSSLSEIIRPLIFFGLVKVTTIKHKKTTKMEKVFIQTPSHEAINIALKNFDKMQTLFDFEQKRYKQKVQSCVTIQKSLKSVKKTLKENENCIDDSVKNRYPSDALTDQYSQISNTITNSKSMTNSIDYANQWYKCRNKYNINTLNLNKINKNLDNINLYIYLLKKGAGIMMRNQRKFSVREKIDFSKLKNKDDLLIQFNVQSRYFLELLAVMACELPTSVFEDIRLSRQYKFSVWKIHTLDKIDMINYFRWFKKTKYDTGAIASFNFGIFLYTGCIREYKFYLQKNKKVLRFKQVDSEKQKEWESLEKNQKEKKVDKQRYMTVKSDY